MKKILLAIVLVLALSNVSYACTSIAVETTDKFLFYARTMEDHVQFNSKVIVVPKGSDYQGQLPDGSYKGMKYKTLYGMVGMNTFYFPYIWTFAFFNLRVLDLHLEINECFSR